jgi:hypothetical protein
MSSEDEAMPRIRIDKNCSSRCKWKCKGCPFKPEPIKLEDIFKPKGYDLISPYKKGKVKLCELR